MAGPDASAIAALRSYTTPVNAIYCGFLDIVGDPIRVTTAPYSIAFTGTGDADLDGFTFSAVEPDFISVSPVTMKEGGADTVTTTLSGLIGVDTTLLNQIGNKANWQGRVARLWQLQIDEALAQVGAVWPWFTGYMTVPKIVGDKASQTIQLEIESYLDATDYDSGDLSAAASIACANGTSAAGQAIVSTGGAVSGIIATNQLRNGMQRL
jgi:hypothetical protein